MTEPFNSRGPDRAIIWLCAAAAALLPFVLFARAATFRTGVGARLAATSAPQLILLVGIGFLVHRVVERRAAGRPRPQRLVLAVGATTVVVTLVGLAIILVAAVMTSADGDPSGHGLMSPHGTSVWLVVAASALGLGFGMCLVPMRRRWGRLRAADPRVWAPLAIAGIAALAFDGRQAAPVALFISLAIALVLSGIAVVASGAGERPTSARNEQLAIGATVGSVVCTPSLFTLIGRHYPDQISGRLDQLRFSGPSFAASVWVLAIGASVGLLVMSIVLEARWAWPQRRVAGDRVRRGAHVYRPAILATAFLFRVVALFTVSTARRDGGDQLFYHVTANMLAQGRAFGEPLNWLATAKLLPSALHGPLFPMVLSLGSRLGATSYFDHQMLSIFLGLPQVIAVMMLGRLLGGHRLAIVAGLLVCIYPNIWITDGSLFVEGLMASLTLFATWCAYRWLQTPQRRYVIALGVLTAAAALTRGEAVLLIVLLLAPLVLRGAQLSWRQRWLQCALGVGGFVVVLAPWMIYNATRFNVSVPLSTNSNEVLFYANCDDVYSGRLLGFWSYDCQVRYRAEFGEAPGDQAEQAVFWRGLAGDYVRDHWRRVPIVVAARVGRQWELFRPSQTIDFAFIEGRPQRAVRIGQQMYYVMMLFAAAGTWALRKAKQLVWPLWIHALAVTITAAYAYGTLRFRAPFEPVLCLLAAAGVLAVVDRVSGRRMPAAVDAAADGEGHALPTP